MPTTTPLNFMDIGSGKKHRIPFLWLLIGFISGVLLTLLCWFGIEKTSEIERYKYCKNREYSFINLADALTIRQNERGTECIFESITIYLEGEETSFIDEWSGQMRQYHKGILFLLWIAEYDSPGPSYQQYQIRSLEECEMLSQLLQTGNTAEIKAAGGRIWQMESGEIFVD